MKIGNGKYRIDPIVYYKKVILLFSNPEWFFKDFYPKIKIEVIYTILLLNLALGTVLNFILGPIFWGRSPFAFIASAFTSAIFMAIGCFVGALILLVLNSLFMKIKFEFNDFLKMTCFSLTLTSPLTFSGISGYLSVISTIVFLIVGVYLWYLIFKHYFKVSPTFLKVYLGLQCFSLAMMAFTMITAFVAFNKISNYSYNTDKYLKELKQLERDLENLRSH